MALRHLWKYIKMIIFTQLVSDKHWPHTQALWSLVCWFIRVNVSVIMPVTECQRVAN